MKKTNPFKAVYEGKALWIILSLLISLSIWIYVTSVDSEEATRTFPGVPVELVGEDTLLTSRGLLITDVSTSTVTVELRGPRRIVNLLDSSELVAQVDVSKLSQPAYASLTYQIIYPSGTDRRSLTEVIKTPDTVSFYVSKQTSISVPVRGGFEGSLAEGFTAETPTFEPTTVTVSGPEIYLRDIEYAWVTFGKDEVVDSTYTMETGFALMDEDGEPVSTTELTTSVDTIRATLPILATKEISLGVDVIEGAGATVSNTKIRIEPEYVILAGDSAILSGINRILLGTVDLRDFPLSYEQTYTIPIPNELRNLTGTTESKVTVEIVGLDTRQFRVDQLSYINLDEGMEAQFISESLEVTLRGTPEQLAQITPEMIRAEADLGDFHEPIDSIVLVKIYVDGVSEVGALYEYSVAVEIRRSET